MTGHRFDGWRADPDGWLGLCECGWFGSADTVEAASQRWLEHAAQQQEAVS